MANGRRFAQINPKFTKIKLVGSLVY